MITEESKKKLKEDLEEWDEGLSEACGCYVFGIRAGKGIRPFYVGQALKRSIVNEALNPSNLLKYNKVLARRGAGAPVIFVLPWLTPNYGRYKRRTKVNRQSSTLDFLEDWLIGIALQRNGNLINNRKTRLLRRVHVTGVFNPQHGESTWEAQRFNAMMGLS
jgi:hypothetical protein